MKPLFVTLLIFAAAATLPGPAFSAEKSEVAKEMIFRFGGVEFSMPIPDGYCEPKGKDVDVAQAVAAIDSLNVTHLILKNCDPKLSDLGYFILKTPKNALFASVPRAEFLSAIEKELGRPENQQKILGDKDIQEVSAGIERVLNMKVSMDAAIGFRATDETCAYIGGYASYTNIPKPYKIALGMCMTSIENKIITVSAYGPPEDNGDVGRLMAQSKAIAASIKGMAATE